VNGGGAQDVLCHLELVMFGSSGADSMGHVPPPHFYKWLGTGGTVSRLEEQQTRN